MEIGYFLENNFRVLGYLFDRVFLKGWDFPFCLDGIVYFIKHVDGMVDIPLFFFEVDIEDPAVPIDIRPPLRAHLLEK